ncbi:5-(carboxyamino)imidazole ribonucleotide synthase [Solemya velum gill symbiont]|uniref:5-(carboxyamino)imidazole ribonucleotide synthase n=1 Tax=Solemya velum gill symbiont TaxID=2340 RepID=UPI000996ECF4|nr:5-(carboxyamino)imidazole ribonucleotide synthase [Solemya velum gill symbiont]OOZ15036.1 5-(carboxyamino)imidazole ribonucleotide synthase [Solemya velum gill symbiont]OOZ19684.1 5-(carboxyamino)imidazole ribonucleotide synthase [Solemya velum gill symbiont]OOZ22081.1 5-(carboxyamino)imidazole ribonucleotide synthase [Solemya velum gill symbiont]OOZ25364.1 5-(carboxyamino)imidazole ribonucleotide synthase [Solemya velum gill symbiont]OOZ29536.1 5-(carboxyamino)imidazole ribonucleotide synt
MIIGIIGGGQLARMMALAGIPLGMRFIFLDPAEDACASALGEHLCGEYDDRELLNYMAEKADVVTYEFENVPASAIEYLNDKVGVAPSAEALATARDRLNEKNLFRELGIPTVPFATVDSFGDLQLAVEEIGLPAILKTRVFGYDGKGQVLLRDEADLQQAWDKLKAIPLILEGFASFQREISIVSVRGHDGEIRFYPLSENVHRDGILNTSESLPDDPKQSVAEEYARRTLERLDYVGVLAIEFFDMGKGLIVNEMAPRVHNSGHWTIEGALTNQFENHIRAVAKLPLGSTDADGYARMINFIGEIPEIHDLLSNETLHLHHYDKKPKPGRKVGHATYWSTTKIEHDST